MNNDSEESGDTSEVKSQPQVVRLVKPPKKLIEMTRDERRLWAISLGEAFKKKQTPPD